MIRTRALACIHASRRAIADLVSSGRNDSIASGTIAGESISTLKSRIASTCSCLETSATTISFIAAMYLTLGKFSTTPAKKASEAGPESSRSFSGGLLGLPGSGAGLAAARRALKRSARPVPFRKAPASSRPPKTRSKIGRE